MGLKEIYKGTLETQQKRLQLLEARKAVLGQNDKNIDSINSEIEQCKLDIEDLQNRINNL